MIVSLEGIDMENSRPSYLSKTLWLNALSAICALFIPSVNEWVNAHPDMVVGIFTALNIVLRFVTKDKIELY